jgi:hypothetical protein
VIARLALLACVALASNAQDFRPPSSQMPPSRAASTLRGQVVDADSGVPLAGAVLVLRWGWLTYIPSRFQGGGSYADLGETLKVSEAVSDAQGRFTLAGPGHPILKTTGKPEDKAPSLAVFKSGYEPFTKDGGDDSGMVRLKRHAGTGAELAAKIAKMQGNYRDGLHWGSDKETGEQMPRMLLAIHREKVRLGDDGAAILGADALAGRSGKGTAVDAITGQGLRVEKLPGEPYPAGAVWTAWTMRRVDGGPGAKRLIYARTLMLGDSPSTFTVSPWRVPGPDSTPGWEAVKDAPPLVRVYAPGYRPSAPIRWNESGTAVRLDKLPPNRDAVVENTRALRRDIDAERDSYRDEWVEDMRPVLALLAFECRALTPDLRAGICFAEDSEVAAQLRRRATATVYDRDPAPPPQVQAISVGAGRSTIQAQSVAMPASQPGQRRSVGGFTIEPIAR